MDAAYDVMLRNGVVVNADGRQSADVAVRGDTIVAIGRNLPGPAQQVIDASGCYVFPGFVDPHVHMSLPVGDMVSSDDFESGSIAAACGGVTTIIDFTVQARGVSLEQAVAERRAQADGRVAIDYGLHLTVMDAAPRTLAGIERLAAEGFPSIKTYMTYPSLMVNDDDLRAIMQAAAGCGARTLVHAEDHALVTDLTARLVEQGRAGPGWFPLSRPSFVEAGAVERALALAHESGAALYVVHVSSGRSAAAIAAARQVGLDVCGETCPHYLLLTNKEYERPRFAAAKYVMTPPLRALPDLAALWQALAGGVLDVVATDHCPWLFKGQKTRGRERFDLIPGGIAGVETRAPLLFSEGVGKGRLTLERFVAVMSTNAARTFGLYPRKGVVAVGSDADLVVFDPRRQDEIRLSRLHSRVDYTVFEGWPVMGMPVATISRGRGVARHGEFVGEIGHGQFVARQAIRR